MEHHEAIHPTNVKQFEAGVSKVDDKNVESGCKNSVIGVLPQHSQQCITVWLLVGAVPATLNETQHNTLQEQP